MPKPYDKQWKLIDANLVKDLGFKNRRTFDYLYDTNDKFKRRIDRRCKGYEHEVDPVTEEYRESILRLKNKFINEINNAIAHDKVVQNDNKKLKDNLKKESQEIIDDYNDEIRTSIIEIVSRSISVPKEYDTQLRHVLYTKIGLSLLNNKQNLEEYKDMGISIDQESLIEDMNKLKIRISPQNSSINNIDCERCNKYKMALEDILNVCAFMKDSPEKESIMGILKGVNVSL